MSREAETDARQRALQSDDCAEAVRALKWIKDFCFAHHAGERSGVHLHRLLVDIPHYLDYVIATLEAPPAGAAVDPHAPDPLGPTTRDR